MSAAEGVPASPDRTRPPAPGELRSIELPRFERFRLGNGVEVRVAQDRQLPEASVRLVVEAGAVRDPTGLEGAAELTGRLLTEGAGDRSAVEMARWIDRLGAGFGASVRYDVAFLSVHAVSDVLGGALDFLRATVREPTFRPDEFERVRQEQLDELERERDKPEVVADDALIRAIFGDHRYGTPSAGLPGTLSDVGRGDVVDLHRRAYTPRGAIFVACGDVDPEALGEGLERRFGDWEPVDGVDAGSGRAAPEGGPADAGVLVVDRPGSAQAEVRLGTVGAPYGADDYYEAVVANAILGGLFNSRVNMNLREDKGWTYGARTRFHFRRHPGPFVARAAVETPAAARALEEFRAEIRGMWERPPEEEELQLAKNALALSLPRQFETVSQVSRKVARQLAYGLPEDYWERFRERVEAVDREGVVEVVERRLHPDSLRMIVAADAESVVPDLEASFDHVEVR